MKIVTLLLWSSLENWMPQSNPARLPIYEGNAKLNPTTPRFRLYHIKSQVIA